MPTHKTVLITGASSGVGRATAQLLSQCGYTVFGTSRNPVAVEPPPNVQMLALDVRSDDAVRDCVQAAGPIDILINNAGYELAGAVEETAIDEVIAQFDTNIFGIARMVRAALPMMRERRRGHIVNVSSLAGVTAIPFMAMYTASKFAVEGYTEALRHEVRPFNIHVSLVEMGFLRSPMMEHRQISREQIAEYAASRQHALDAILTAERNGPGPELIAHTIRAAIESRKPRLRYVTGREAQLVSRLRRWLPEAAFENGVRRNFKLDA
jgi:NAD(P)-dependent dehydrogenase (short-subunit alcohol dehydrogenase family)